MLSKHKLLILLAGLIFALQGFYAPVASSAPVTVDSETLQRLENLISAQQKQLESLQEEVNQLKQQQIQQPAVTSTGQGPAAAPPAKVVTSGEEKVKLAISGQINRALSIADDGDKTDAYFVDSDASNTKVRFVGTALVDEDLTLGGKLEVAFAPNESGDVSQDSQESGDFTDQRYAELTLTSKRYGMLYLGKGDTSSNGTAEVDLSGTDLIQYASTADIVGGLFFRQSGDDELTDITVAGAFKDFDGLSRKSRLRYDTPNFHGFGLSGSVISDRRWDTALRWGGDGYGLKAAAAAAVAYINEDEDPGKGLPNADYQYDGSFSVLHEATGLNVTFSAGTKDADNQTDPYNLWGKIGWLTSLNSFGKTAFGLDYGHSENIAADDYEGDTFGVAVVQNFDDWATQVYFQYRNFSLDTDDDPNVSDINVGSIGARVKF
ncbi:MAG: porin [Deltaproteobacteria bacterium]|jgi:hypothetical protein|nr:porin [Deltaproteobacteria bacterium]